MPRPTLKLPPRPTVATAQASERRPLRGGPPPRGGQPPPNATTTATEGSARSDTGSSAARKTAPRPNRPAPADQRRADSAATARRPFKTDGTATRTVRDATQPIRPRATAQTPQSRRIEADASVSPARRAPKSAPSRERGDSSDRGDGTALRARPAAPTQRPATKPSRDTFDPGERPRTHRAPRPTDATDTEPPRLSRLMSERGMCSRREADEWIEAGWVKVDGQVVATLGTRVAPQSRIEIDARAQGAQAERVTILLHKPIAFVSGQAEDGYTPAVKLISDETRWEDDPLQREFTPAQLRGLAPAGRLDIDSTGLLVFTQDGRIARALVGENSNIEKEYLVRVEGTLDAAGLALLNHGLALDGVALKPAKVSWANEDQLRVVLRQGRKRQIRRMCELVGLKVTGLKRIRIGAVVLGKLPLGQWRYLRRDEKF